MALLAAFAVMRTEASECGVGSYDHDGNMSCTACPAGKTDHDRNASTPCEACAAGRYNANASAVGACTACAAGSEPVVVSLLRGGERCAHTVRFIILALDNCFTSVSRSTHGLVRNTLYIRANFPLLLPGFSHHTFLESNVARMLATTRV